MRDPHSSLQSFILWHGRVVLIGTLINIFGMALPFIFAPQWFLNFFGLPGGGGSLVWMRQAGLLLLFISILYVPGGYDPIRYNLNASFAVIVRMTIGLYWVWLVLFEGQTRSFLIFGALDCVYAVFNALLLQRVRKAQNASKSSTTNGPSEDS